MIALPFDIVLHRLLKLPIAGEALRHYFQSRPSDTILDEDARYLLATGSRLAIVAAAFQTLIHAVGVAGGIEFLNVNAESNPVAWSHSVLIFSSAVVCSLHIMLAPSRRLVFLILAVIFSFLSLDEMDQVHEHLVKLVLDVFHLPIVWDSVLWPVLYMPLAGLLVLLLISATEREPFAVRRIILIGVAFLSIAVAAEVVSAPISTGGDWPHNVEGGFEEAAEIVGWTLIATGLAAAFTPAIRQLPTQDTSA